MQTTAPSPVASTSARLPHTRPRSLPCAPARAARPVRVAGREHRSALAALPEKSTEPAETLEETTRKWGLEAGLWKVRRAS